jgi:hypothetical protein
MFYFLEEKIKHSPSNPQLPAPSPTTYSPAPITNNSTPVNNIGNTNSLVSRLINYYRSNLGQFQGLPTNSKSLLSDFKTTSTISGAFQESLDSLKKKKLTRAGTQAFRAPETRRKKPNLRLVFSSTSALASLGRPGRSPSRRPSENKINVR